MEKGKNHRTGYRVTPFIRYCMTTALVQQSTPGQAGTDQRTEAQPHNPLP